MSIITGHVAVSKGSSEFQSVITQKWFGNYLTDEGVTIKGGRIIGVEVADGKCNHTWSDWLSNCSEWEAEYWNKFTGHDVVEYKFYISCPDLEDAYKVFNAGLVVLADGVTWSPFTLAGYKPTHFRELVPDNN